MPTLFSVRAYRIVIRTNDHTPAHVHGLGPDGEVKIELGDTPADMRLVYNLGVSRKDLVAIVDEVGRRHRECYLAWGAIHGR
ncbi:MAG: DUF4160 domain-containing protein [Burkholderiales bacterium]|nr:DUF4160 domain-containing protein [Burkholderiales bacterium]